jgi:hypothetical protein
MKPALRQVGLAVALVGALALAVWGDRRPPAPPIAEAVGRVHSGEANRPLLGTQMARLDTPSRAGSPAIQAGVVQTRELDLPRLLDRQALMGRGELGRSPGAEASGPQLFASVLPKPVPAPSSDVPAQAVATAPPLPFSYLGRQFDGQAWQLFLRRENGDVLIVRQGEEIDGEYRVASLSAEGAVFIYLPLNQSQPMSFD